MISKASVAAILFLTFLAPHAVADLITFHFTGTVAGVDSALAGTFDTTQTMSGSYTFDSALADADLGDPLLGIYAPLMDLSLTIGGYTATLGVGTSSDMSVLDNFGGQDRYGVQAAPLSGLEVAGLTPNDFGFFLFDFSESVFGSDALPLTPPDLSLFGPNFADRRWSLNFHGPSGFGGGIEGEITSLKLVEPVPEPGTLLLLGSGLLGLVRYAKKKTGRKLSV